MIGLAFFLVLSALSTSPPDATAPRIVITQPDESKFPAITVYFEVRNPDGTFVRDAKQDEFRVTEDGQERPIDSFEAPTTLLQKPTTIVLVIDRSGSMRQDGKMIALRRAVAAFLEDLPPGSRVAVIAFGSTIETVCPFTTDRTRIQDAVDGLEPVGATRYFDAVTVGLKLLAQETGRRAVLAMTDGQDTDSEVPIDVPIMEGRRLSLPVHTLGLGRGGSIDTESLDRLAEGTRGQSYRASDAASLRSIYQELAERIGSTYSLSYQTNRKIPDGTLRPIRVYYAKGLGSGEASVFIPGMVVPASGWSGLFLVLVAVLVGLLVMPGHGKRRKEGIRA